MCISIITTCILNLYIGNRINICCAVKIIYKSWLVVFYKKKKNQEKTTKNPDTNKVFSQLLFRKVIKKGSGGC